MNAKNMKKSDFKKRCLDNDSRQVIEGKGKNIIPPAKGKSLFLRYLEKFEDPIIIVLLIVFCFSVGVSIYEIVVGGRDLTTLIEPAGVLAALLLATGVGFAFEVKAEREFRVLNKKKDERKVKVLRWLDKSHNTRPQMLQVMKSDVVVGDIVRLESGDEVPADGRLIVSEGLSVDESAFTGEMYAHKMCGEPTAADEQAYPADFLLRGSIVLEGQCYYEVTAVGMDTEEGKGAKLIQEENNVQTPLNKQLDDLGQMITKASYIIAGLIVAGRLIYYFFFDGNADNNYDFLSVLSFTLDSVMIAVTLIVVAVPEGLPMSVTLSLALSMRQMLKQNNLVRKLHACETMGATTVICTDKTGTLTKNKLRVMEDSEELYVDIDTVARCIAVNSTAELSFQADGRPRSIGNPTEGSLLYWLKRRKDIDYQEYRDAYTIVKQVAFTPETKYMTTIATDNRTGKTYEYVKGAPEIVLDLCGEVASGKTREQVREGLARLQDMGRRTLAFAMRELPSADMSTADGGVDKSAVANPLVFIGFVGMTDPVRPDVPDAVETCHRAGVNVIMVTGDVALTALNIARETGIVESDDDQALVVTGAEFEAMSDEKIKSEILPHLKVLSRARPADKARLVTLLQQQGQVVAVTGDGTNDAPALKKAQVGLSMGDGTARAKEASDITIIDNSFSSINTAILWGRSLYLNIRRFILFQMTINVCACMVVLIGAFMGLDSPLNVTQMLWVNLIMDTFAAMALSSLPADPRVMSDPPRSANSHIIDRQMATNIICVGLAFFVLLFGLWQLLWHVDATSVRDLLSADTLKVYVTHLFDFSKSKPHLSHYETGLFFTTFVFMQFWNLFNARYFKTDRSLLRDMADTIRHPRNFSKHYSKGFVLILFVVLFGQVLIVNVFGEMFAVAPLSVSDWLWLLLLTSPILLIGELIRAIVRG